MTESWRTAITATLHCLTGCAIGEVLGMVLATWWGWSTLPSLALAIALAFFFGYLLTFSRSAAPAWTSAPPSRIALAADTVSILGHGGRRQRVPGAAARARWRPR